MRIVAFTRYDRESAATRQRFLQYAPYFEAAGIAFEYRPLLEQGYVHSLTTGEAWPKTAIARSYARRAGELLRRLDADFVWVYGELFPYLPLSFEKLLLRTGIPMVIDWDDANFVRYNDSGSRIVRGLLGGKLERLMGAAVAATCGNRFLCDYASRYCRESIVVPTVIDAEIYCPDVRDRAQLVIGWIGSPSTWLNVRPILPVLRALCAGGKARFRVVGAGVAAEADRFDGMELVRWSEESEVAEVQGFDIGIMPLVDAPFERGKSAYKLVQYMGCGVPAVASPVGANSEVLTAECGLLATGPGEWKDALERLIGDPALRARLGAGGRARAIEHYSLQAHAPRLIALFRRLGRSQDQAGG